MGQVMRARSRWGLGAALALAAVIATQTAALATSYTDSVSGVEVYATSTEGAFAGQASGSLPGYWYADVDHTPLGGSQQPQITGGTFDLSTAIGGQPTLVTGTFAGGSIQQTSGFTGCTNQTYTVTGQLSKVGPYGASQVGTGLFDAVLTHYRYEAYGYCITYAASVTGSVELSF
jgi:hypothetical protein